MRGFIILCLSAVALAAPQGYNYNGPSGFGGVSSGSSSISSIGSGSSIGSIGSGSGSGGFFQASQQVAPVQHFQQHYQPQQQSFVQQHHQVEHQQQHQQTLVSKRFFIHSAPEDVEEDYKERHITVGVPKRNYNVVFIKSPQRSNKKTSIKISPAVNEEKTVIYVLNKKADSSDVQAEVIEHQSSTAKPEVFFIKYKTNEEAAHAQQQIQAQYDALGGSSQITDEGVAPVTSVIGALGGAGDGSAGSAIGGTGLGASSGHIQVNSHHGHSATGNAYLPPNF